MNEADELSETVVGGTKGEAVDGMTEVAEASNAGQGYSPQPLGLGMVDQSTLQAEMQRFSSSSFSAQSPAAIANSTLCDASR